MLSNFSSKVWNFYITRHNIYFELQNWFLNSKYLRKYVNFSPLAMTVPTNISEPPMAHTKQKPFMDPRVKKHPIAMELYQHVFDTVLGICHDDQLETVYNRVSYRGFLSFDDIHKQYCYNPNRSLGSKHTHTQWR